MSTCFTRHVPGVCDLILYSTIGAGSEVLAPLCTLIPGIPGVPVCNNYITGWAEMSAGLGGLTKLNWIPEVISESGGR